MEPATRKIVAESLKAFQDTFAASYELLNDRGAEYAYRFGWFQSTYDRLHWQFQQFANAMLQCNPKDVAEFKHYLPDEIWEAINDHGKD